MRWTCCLLAAAPLLLGCATHAGDHSSSSASAAVAASASQPSGPEESNSGDAGPAIPLNWTTLKLDDLRPLIRVAKAGESADFAFKLKVNGGGGRTLYFGEMRNADDQLEPVVGTRNGQQYKVVKVEKDWTYDQWAGVFSGPKPGDVWAVLDQADDQEGGDDNRSDTITLLRSNDGGQSFQVAPLHKPCPKATFSDLVMSRNGRGRVTLSLAEDCGKFKMGLYHYRTTDGGRTFQRPQYEPDATKPAEDVPDDEQPTQGDQSASAR